MISKVMSKRCLTGSVTDWVFLISLRGEGLVACRSVNVAQLRHGYYELLPGTP